VICGNSLKNRSNGIAIKSRKIKREEKIPKKNKKSRKLLEDHKKYSKVVIERKRTKKRRIKSMLPL
jgi:uncharacterized protein (DUF488 family)